MKKLLIASLAAVALLAGCGNLAVISAPPPTVAQVTAQLCPLAKEVGSILLAPGALPASDQAIITKAAPAVTKMCAVGATVVATDLKSFATASLPDILDVVNGSALPQADKMRISTGLLLAQVAIGSLK